MAALSSSKKNSTSLALTGVTLDHLKLDFMVMVTVLSPLLHLGAFAGLSDGTTSGAVPLTVQYSGTQNFSWKE
jgi:hypothetical protein